MKNQFIACAGLIIAGISFSSPVLAGSYLANLEPERIDKVCETAKRNFDMHCPIGVDGKPIGQFGCFLAKAINKEFNCFSEN